MDFFLPLVRRIPFFSGQDTPSNQEQETGTEGNASPDDTAPGSAARSRGLKAPYAMNSTSATLSSYQSLFGILTDALDLPPHLAVRVLDFLQYWPRAVYCLSASMAVDERFPLRVTNGKRLLVSAKLEVDALHLRQIVFEIEAKDQGWSTNAAEFHGTFEASYTWFEAVVLPPPKSTDTERPGTEIFFLPTGRQKKKKTNYPIHE